MYYEMESQWSREQIASALPLAGAGVPVADIAQTMGAAPGTVSAWKREYAALLGKLIRRSALPDEFKPAANAARVRRTAYMSACIDKEEVECELRACKIRYSVVDNAAARASQLLRAGKVLGNLQIPYRGEDALSNLDPPLENSLEPAVPRRPPALSSANLQQAPEMKVPEASLSSSGYERESLYLLVNAELADSSNGAHQTYELAGELTLLGAVTEEIDQLRWWSDLGSGGTLDEPIIQDGVMKYTLDAVLDTCIHGIRAFYTSSIDALLLGKFLILKSELR